jgi:hypothetical protein
MFSALEADLNLDPPTADPEENDVYHPPVSVSLSDVSDVITGGEASRYILAYNAASGLWESTQRIETQRASPASTGFSVSVVSPTSLSKDIWLIALRMLNPFAVATV